MAAVWFDRLTMRYPGALLPALDQLDLRVADGEFLVLVGPTGCGKSTTLRLAAGLETPTAGAVWIGDRDVTQLPPRERLCGTAACSRAAHPTSSTNARATSSWQVFSARPRCTCSR